MTRFGAWLAIMPAIVLATIALAHAQAVQPDAQFNQYALQILKQQRDQAMDQIVALGAQLAAARQELERSKSELADLKKKEEKDAPGPQDH